MARYLLPLATNTSLGQIVNARTLETQVSRLLSHPAAEVRDLGVKLREAATGPAWNVNAQAGAALSSKSSPQPDAASPGRRSRPAPHPRGPHRSHAGQIRPAQRLRDPDPRRTGPGRRRNSRTACPSQRAPLVDLVERTETLEVELAATLLYSASHHPYRQIRDLVAGLPDARVSEIIELGLRHRGKHDEALRAFHAGAALRFDILMDIGGFRDMHRHRRCTQIIQPFTALHGYETPGSGDLAAPDVDILAEAGILADYHSAIEAAHAASAQIAASQAPEAAQSALYLLPLATRIRSLFKMDFAEAQYITELRSGPAGHFSYRRVAWEMFLALAAPAPIAGRAHPRHRLHQAHRPAAEVNAA